ncbi:hypothetical protein CHS0354_007678 [Potamilus streckersoni]|uniref:Uncharacterized protein n=1 Tax=Potamilus streckersoni TaxID=2493646 RepID=A0AAE0SH28_9BIVA|nr:hypothetical protein CHS0354_007678 [Potamilus streckersoni]
MYRIPQYSTQYSILVSHPSAFYSCISSFNILHLYLILQYSTLYSILVSHPSVFYTCASDLNIATKQ